MSLSSPERQGLIDQLSVIGSWPNEVRDAVKALGGANQPRWQSLGDEPTLESVIAELNALNNQIQKVAITAATKHAMNTALSQIESSEQALTFEELIQSIEDTLTANWPQVN